MGFLVLYRKTLPTLPWGSAVLSAFCGPAALAGLWSWPVRLTRTQNLVSIPDLLTQNLYNPGESCSQYRLRSARLEPLLRSSCVCTLPQVQAAREDQGVWPPGVLPTPGRALNTWTLESLFPVPVQASLLGPIFQPDRWSRFSCLLGRRGWPELGLEGWRCSCLSRRLLRAQKRSEPEVGRTGVGLGAGSAPPSAVLPSGSKLRGPGIQACQVVMRVYFTVC